MTSRSASGWTMLRPAPERLWIGQAPRSWLAATTPYCDLAVSRVRAGGATAVLSAVLPEELPSEKAPLYLPPTFDSNQNRKLDDFVSRALSGGIPVVRQRLAAPAGEGLVLADCSSPATERECEMYLEVIDPLWLILTGQLDELWHCLDQHCSELSRIALVWPLVAGLQHEPESLLKVASKLAEAGCHVLQPCWLEVEPLEKRVLFDGWPDAFDYHRLFGITSADDRLAIETKSVDTVLQAGMATSAPRLYSSDLSPRQRRCREIGRFLALRAEELERSEGSAARVQSFYIAFNTVETTHLNVDALWRDGNLNFLGIDPEPLAFLQQQLDSDESS